MLHIRINSETELLKHVFLNRITFLSFQEKNFLAKNYLLAEQIAELSREQLEMVLHRDFTKRVIWNGTENLNFAKVALHYCKLLDIQLVINTDREYPELLRQISDPPYLLFCRGNVNILADKSVSVVGTRKISQNGKTAARQFAYDAVVDGCNVISGLASGVDGYSHQGAIDAFFDYEEKGLDTMKLGKTIAVIPSAIDEIVPGNHKRMAAQIIQSGGLIISEYEPKLGMANWHFVGRNRIIAGLSPATVVIEAPSGSGALITAEFALENGRDVMFHQVCFSKNATEISQMVKKQLTDAFEKGKVSKYKVENSVEKYMEAGAPVVKDYKDFCRALTEVPGTRVQKKQGELFDDL